MITLRKAQMNGKLDDFIKEHEPMEADKEPLQCYIDASATPLESKSKGRSKSRPDFSADYK